jgi:SH3 domain-containing YSC84-like protein 1
MRRILLAAAALAALPLLAPRVAHAQSDEQTLVDRATLSVQEMATGAMSDDRRSMLQRSSCVQGGPVLRR